ncbi:MULTISPECIES: sensor histidine kinase [Sphingobacterium]|uniref:sensor histidine kinase n=1 Tax=Sphingobacterium TaxID=28453 RepID=UPI001551FEF2|nr:MULTISPECIES: histidine kinase [unclassified Sphingobacterium]NPE47636.1 histidine kinase [Sphingobacterium prati]
MISRFFKKFYLHIVIWIILLFLPFITYLYQPDKIADFKIYSALSHLGNIIFLASSFYLHCYVVAPRYFFGRRKIFIALIAFGFFAYVLLNYAIVYFNPDGELAHLKKENVLFVRLVIGPGIIYSLCMITSSMIFLYDEQARQKELNKQIALEKTTAELTILKLQISPHFLFNTLNNIRWLIRKQSPDSEGTIVKLSEILRYILYEVDGPKVELFKEIDHMRNFIALQTLRLPIEGHVDLKIDRAVKNRMIPPLLFIHFVENAFKYGVDSKNIPYIQFQFVDIPGGIAFKSVNKILLYTESRLNEGIGLTNVKRRLQLLYPNRHDLSIQRTTDGYFEVTLRLMTDED